MVMKKPQKISSPKKSKTPIKRLVNRAKPEIKSTVAPKKIVPALAPIRPTFGGAFVDDEIKLDDDVTAAADVIVPKMESTSVILNTNNLATPSATLPATLPTTPTPELGSPIVDDIDSRQQFFKMMSEKIKENDPSKESEDIDNAALKNKSISLYRKIAIRFAIFAGIIALVVAYFCFTKLTISVSLNQELVNDNLIFDVYGNGNPGDATRGLAGNVNHFDSEISGVYQATGVSTSAAQFAGQVTLYNNSPKDQPLVASTRLLSADNKLFRIKNSVDVKAGQSVDVAVYPDVASSDMAIAPTKFTVPGLWSGLQDKIYAESKTDFTFASDNKKIIQQSDVDAAVADLDSKLLDQVENSVGGSNNQYDEKKYVTSTPPTIESVDAKVGDVKDQFTVKIKNTVNIISFNSTDLIKLAIDTKAAEQNKDKSMFAVDKDSLKFNINTYDSNSNIANVSADFVLKSSSDNSNLIDKTKIVNLNEDQLRSYLATIKEIKDYDLKFFPSFIKRAPGLVDRIAVVTK
jgi:hypothetical protein